MKELKTKRLRIMPLTNDQLSDKMKKEPDEHMRKAYAEMLIGCMEHPKERLWYTDWQIYLRDGIPVGSFGFKGPPKNGEVEIGYGIDVAHQNKGYAAEAVKAAVNWAFSKNGVYFITAETEPENAASQRVLEKLEFSPAGTGEEGPRFERERPASGWLSLYLCVGLCFGASMGLAFRSLGIGVAVGLCLGVAVGSAFDHRDKKKRAGLKEARGSRKTSCGAWPF